MSWLDRANAMFLGPRPGTVAGFVRLWIILAVFGGAASALAMWLVFDRVSVVALVVYTVLSASTGAVAQTYKVRGDRRAAVLAHWRDGIH